MIEFHEQLIQKGFQESSHGRIFKAPFHQSLDE